MNNNKLKTIDSKEVSISKRESILKLQDHLVGIADEINIVTHQNSDLFPLKHTFADGIYVRQMSMCKDTFVVGAIHKHLHVWFLLTGNISVVTEDKTEDYIAPCYVVAEPGTKRVIYANENSLFVNIHKNPSNTQDIDVLTKEIVADTYEEYEEYINNQKK